jgi:hypothetical protein
MTAFWAFLAGLAVGLSVHLLQLLPMAGRKAALLPPEDAELPTLQPCDRPQAPYADAKAAREHLETTQAQWQALDALINRPQPRRLRKRR